MRKYNVSSRKPLSLMVLMLFALFFLYLLISPPTSTVIDITGVLPLHAKDILPPKYKTILRNHTRQIYTEITNITLEDVRKPLCELKTNVAFLKVHKAGSTTVMNIFLRFGVRNRLNIVLPNRGYGGGFNYLGYGETVKMKNIVPIPKNETYNILCNHVVYDKTAFSRIMPNDSLYIGIIREPLSQFLSASVYYGFLKKLVRFMHNSGTQAIFSGTQQNITRTRSSDVYHEYFTNMGQYQSVSTTYVRNRMSFDFGLPVSRFMDENFIDNFISGLDKDFKLVMIMERFLESLILMKRILCWELSDILYVPLNINKSKIKKAIKMFPADEWIFRDWARADVKLYNFFYAKFERQIQAEGTDFQNEVEYFKKMQKMVVQYCRSANTKTLVVKKSIYNREILVTRKLCRIMTTSELRLMKILIEKAKSRYSKWVKTKLVSDWNITK